MSVHLRWASLAKCLCVRLQTKRLWVRIQFLSLKLLFFQLFGIFFSKSSFLRLQNFISQSIKYPVRLIFSVVVFICKIYVFNAVIARQIIQIFWIMSPLIMDFFEIFTSGRYHRKIKALKILSFNFKHSRIYGTFNKWQCSSADTSDTTFSLITSFSNNIWPWKCTKECFLT